MLRRLRLTQNVTIANKNKIVLVKTNKNAKPKQKHKKIKPKPKSTPTLNFKNYSHVYVHRCVQLSYTAQHRTVLITFPLILQTIVTSQMLSAGGKGLPFPQ